jgi:hypothetical protein
VIRDDRLFAAWLAAMPEDQLVDLLRILDPEDLVTLVRRLARTAAENRP